MLNRFKQLVDNTPATILCEEDFEEEYKINLENEPIDFPSEKISTELQTILKNLKTGQDKSILNKIERELIYRQVIYNENSIDYLQIIKIMRDVTGSFIYIPKWEDENWKNIIKLAKNYLNFPNYLKISSDELKDNYPKDFNRAESVKFLMNKNCKITIDNGEIEFISGLTEIYNELENKIDKFGGINLIFECLAHLNYDAQFERYIFSKDLNHTKELNTPWGYIINLSLKHLRFKHFSKRSKYDKLFKEIIILASKIINGVYNIQEYNIWSYFFLNLKNIPQYISNLVLYDSLFAISQSNILLELDLCEYLFSFDKDFFRNVLGFELDDFITIGKGFYNVLDEKNKHILINLSKKSEYPLPYPEYSKILNFMSHCANLNKNYVEPNDYQQINFFEKPLIKFDSNSFLLPSISWSAPNFFESLASGLRVPYNQTFNDRLDDILGNRLEEFIAKLLKKYGINFIKGGEYKFKKNKSECDFIIESDESIIIMEVKKKVLTRESKSGRDYKIFIDLSKSLLYSQIQAGKVETLLKRDKKITLDIGDNKKTINLNDRVIKRISLTQFEYGSLYNHIFIKHFLKAQLRGDFTLENGDDNLNREFEKFIKYAKQFRNQYIELNEIQEEDFNYFIYRCYFMSLSQLFEVIKKSKDNNTFDKNLPNNIIEQGSFDWYCDYGLLNK